MGREGGGTAGHPGGRTLGWPCMLLQVSPRRIDLGLRGKIPGFLEDMWSQRQGCARC